MSVIGALAKDPSAVLDYSIDWSEWLSVGDTIATSTWTVPSGITKDSDSKTNTATTIWLSGGISADYVLVNRIVTVAGREDERSILIQVRER